MKLSVSNSSCLRAVEIFKMGRIKRNTVWLLMILKLFLVATATEVETSQFNQQLENKVLQFCQQMRDELEQSKLKEKPINELYSNVTEKNLLLCQNEVEKLRSEQNVTVKLKKDLAKNSESLKICEGQMSFLNFSLIDFELCKDNITKQQTVIKELKENLTETLSSLESLRVQLKELNSSLIEKNEQFCQEEIDKLNSTDHGIPLRCLPSLNQTNLCGIDYFEAECNKELLRLGWRVIQQRVGGNESFDRTWATYREGFGAENSDFFLGLENIYNLTNSQPHEIYIYMVDINGNKHFLNCNSFKLSDEHNDYALDISDCDDSWYEIFKEHANMKFSTFDRDKDLSEHNCAEAFSGGWWYNDCYRFNLNAKDPKYKKTSIVNGKMLIRPKI